MEDQVPKAADPQSAEPPVAAPVPAPTAPAAAPDPEASPTGAPEAPTAAPAVAPAKYGVIQAVKDTLKAIKQNMATYVVALIIGYAVIFIGTIGIVALVAYGFAGSAVASSLSPATLGALAIGGLIAGIIWFAVAGAFFVSFGSLALYAGASGHKTAIGETFRESLKRLKRVLLANLIMMGASLWPLLIVAAIGVFSATQGGGTGIMVIVFAATVGAIIWIYVALLRFALAPYVALFEPDVPVRQVLARSTHLMIKGGQWFVIKGFGLIILLSIVLSVIAPGNSSSLSSQSSGSPIANLIMTLVSILASGVILMLYRNRKVVRG